ncbi:M4 family metallopeptidase [Streptomyces roseolilacinus]|uniref:M4 family metallopeptidase n=1 Tax=Streptomyces roseolilacinus TaxID=66904 RepID=UPI00380389A4
MPHLQRYQYHVADDPRAHEEALGPEAVRDTLRGFGEPGADSAEEASEPAIEFHSPASAARFYLSEMLQEQPQPELRSVIREDRPDRVPDLALLDERTQEATATTIVRFEQTHDEIPVFGTAALVEVDRGNRLVSLDCRLGEVGGVSPVPELSGVDALARVADLTGTPIDAEELPPPELTYVSHHDEWRLAWHLRDVPAQPPEAHRTEDQRGHGLDPSPRDDFPLTGYLVDASTGEVLWSYGMTPTATAVVPVSLEGDDERSVHHRFHGSEQAGFYLLEDRRGQVTTYDLQYADCSRGSLPSTALASRNANLGGDHRAGVSAHVNAARVSRFYREELRRNGIDDASMGLVSTVNCTYSRRGTPRQEWRNAMWWRRRMWYGQTSDGDRLVSLALHLDIVAHEITHGVIETSSGLVYQDESGALNESLADTMGVIIANWYEAADRHDVGTWSWHIGAGLGPGGSPLRDMRDPTTTGDPAHMDQYVHTPHDNGGVHQNSNIHNKAVYHLLTSTDPSGNPLLGVDQWALLVYLAMLRLLPLSGFQDMRKALHAVTKTYLMGNAALRASVASAVDDAYGRVGVRADAPG